MATTATVTAAAQQQERPLPVQPVPPHVQLAQCLAMAKALLQRGESAEAKPLLQAVAAGSQRLLLLLPKDKEKDDSATAVPNHQGADAATGGRGGKGRAEGAGERSRDLLAQLHGQSLLHLGKVLAGEGAVDGAAHCFLLASRSPCPPLRPLASENLRLMFSRLAASSGGGGGAHRLACLHWDEERHHAIVQAAVAALRLREREQQEHATAGGRSSSSVLLVTGPTAALLAVLLARALGSPFSSLSSSSSNSSSTTTSRTSSNSSRVTTTTTTSSSIHILVVEDSRVAGSLGKATVDLNLKESSSSSINIKDSSGSRGSSGASGGGDIDDDDDAAAAAAAAAKGSGWPTVSLQEGRTVLQLLEQQEEEEDEGKEYVGLVFDPFPYTLDARPLRLLQALHRRHQRRAKRTSFSPSSSSSTPPPPPPFCVPEAIRLCAQAVAAPALRHLSQVAPEAGGVVQGFNLGAMDALGRRFVPVDSGSFAYRPLHAPVSTTLSVATHLLPLLVLSSSSSSSSSSAAAAAAAAAAITAEGETDGSGGGDASPSSSSSSEAEGAATGALTREWELALSLPGGAAATAAAAEGEGEREGARVDAVLLWMEAGMLASPTLGQEDISSSSSSSNDTTTTTTSSSSSSRRSGGASDSSSDSFRPLLSCAPPGPYLSEGLTHPLPHPVASLHRWQTAWLDFEAFFSPIIPHTTTPRPFPRTPSATTTAATSAPSSPPRLRLRIGAGGANASDRLLPLSLQWVAPPAVAPLCDPAQPAGRILDYHIPMVNDDDRNAAYAAWIARAVDAALERRGRERPFVRVLDIGAGSGLLGLMAARRHPDVRVTCLEKVEVLAAAAGWVVEENGMDGRVTVVNELSVDVTAEDLGGRFDVLVSEIFGDQPLSESVIPTFRHAQAHLLHPDAIIVPNQLKLWATVAWIEGLERLCGFPGKGKGDRKSHASEPVDMDAAWDCVLESPVSLHLASHVHRDLLAAPLCLGTLDLAQSPLPLQGTMEGTAAVSASVSGADAEANANALVVWFEVGVREGGGKEEGGGEGPTVSTSPAHGQRPHWKQVVYYLPPGELTKGLRSGERLTLQAAYDRDRLRVRVTGRGGGE